MIVFYMEHIALSALFWTQVHKSGDENIHRNQMRLVTKPMETQKNTSFYFQKKLPKRQLIDTKGRNSPPSYQEKSEIVRPDKITVIFAPHPDDEILCCSQKISEKIANKESVRVIYITNGDRLLNGSAHEAQEYGRTRKEESQRAAQALGLKKSDLFFLGFPDGHLDTIDKKGVVKSSSTQQGRSSFESMFPHSPYSRYHLKHNITRLLGRWNVGEVFIPSEISDVHPDHQVTARLVKEVLREGAIQSSVYEYIIHGIHEHNPQSEIIDTKKLSLIRMFESQFWTDHHTKFMERFASLPERFTHIFVQK